MTIQAQITKKEERLELLYKAEAAILKNQSYTIKDRTYSRANYKDVKDEIKRLENEIAKMRRGGTRIQLGVPRSY